MLFACILLSCLCFLPIRDIAAYNKFYLFQSYITTKSKILAALLSRKPKIFKVKKGGEEYRITTMSIVLYIITVVMIIISLAVILFVEEVPTTQIFSHRGAMILINTLNESYALNLFISTLFFNYSLFELNKITYVKRSHIVSAIFWGLCILLAIFVLVYSIGGIIELL